MGSDPIYHSIPAAFRKRFDINKLNIEKTAKATEKDADTHLPDLQKTLEEAKASMLADEGALTKAQLNQLKKTVPKSKGGTVRSSLFGD